MTFLLIIVCLLLILFSLELRFSIKKTVLYNNMDSCYNQIENYILSNHIKIDNNLDRYLFALKTLKVNKEFTDIRVMIMMLKEVNETEIHNNHEEISRLEKKIPAPILQLGEKFYHEANKATRISIFKPGFFVFMIFKTSFVICKSIVNRSHSMIKIYFSLVCDAFKNSWALERVMFYNKQMLSA